MTLTELPSNPLLKPIALYVVVTGLSFLFLTPNDSSWLRLIVSGTVANTIGFTASIGASIFYRHQLAESYLSPALKAFTQLGNKPKRVSFDVYSQGAKEVQAHKKKIAESLCHRLLKDNEPLTIKKFKLFLKKLLTTNASSAPQTNFLEELLLYELLAITKVKQLNNQTTPFFVTFNLILNNRNLEATIAVNLVEFNTLKPLIEELSEKLETQKKRYSQSTLVSHQNYNPRLFNIVPSTLKQMHQQLQSAEKPKKCSTPEDEDNAIESLSFGH